MVHRYGNSGNYVFFGTSMDEMAVVRSTFLYNNVSRSLKLKIISIFQGDDGMDAENLGNGVLVSFAIISPILLISYMLDGRWAVQSLYLEWVIN